MSNLIVVSNTTPLRYLIEIEQEQIIFALYGGCLIPQAVAEELTDPKAPEKIRKWMENLPDWVSIEEIAVDRDPDLMILDRGEIAAITLAQIRKADLLLIDEKLGRRIAKERGIGLFRTWYAKLIDLWGFNTVKPALTENCGFG